MCHLLQIFIALTLLLTNIVAYAQCGGPVPMMCDADGDFDVDSYDIEAISLSNGEPASGPGDVRDIDGDGEITLLDARQCVAECTESLCELTGTTAPELAITFPKDGATVNRRTVEVSGTISDISSVSHIEVNGISANIQENSFVANVELQEGTSQILIVAKNVEEVLASASITVTYDPLFVPNGFTDPLESERISGIEGESRYISNEAIVVLYDTTKIDIVIEFLRERGGVISGSDQEINLYQVKFPNVASAQELDTLIGLLNDYEHVAAASRVWEVDLSSQLYPNDNYTIGFDFAPLEFVNLPEAWDRVYGTTDRTTIDGLERVDIAILDDDFDPNHPDLKDRISTDPDHVVISDSTVLIESHGTAVAGIIGATPNNMQGVSGVAWNANLHFYDDIGAKQKPTTLHMLSEFKRAVKNGAKIVNGSFSSVSADYKFALLMEAVARTAVLTFCADKFPVQDRCAKDVLFVFSVDNDITTSMNFSHTYPANLSRNTANVISVTRVEPVAGTYSPDPNAPLLAQGGNVSVAAPSLHWTTKKRGAGNVCSNSFAPYDCKSGTSYAAPMVSGLAGLLLTYNDSLSASNLKRVIIGGACRGGESVANHPELLSGSDDIAPTVPIIDAFQSVLLADSPGEVGNYWNSATGECTKTGTLALNDTGITFGGDYPEGNNPGCTGVTIEQQDCSHGRDVTHNDPSDGHAGFSYTKLASDGTELPASATTWSCVRDNVTGLVWEVKTDDGGIHDKDNTYRWGGKTAQGSGYGTYYPDWDVLVDGTNSEALCGFGDWRVPSRMELVSLVNFNRFDPAIDTDYFPRGRGLFWSSSPVAVYSLEAWIVAFPGAYIDFLPRSDNGSVRLISAGR